MSSHVQSWAASAETMLYLINIAATATLACAAGLLAACVFRGRPVPVRYGLLHVALVLTLLSVGLAYVAQRLGIGVIQFELRVAPGIPADDVAVESASSAPHAATRPDAPEFLGRNAAAVAQADGRQSPIRWGGVAASLLLAAWATGVAAHLARLAWGAVRVAQFGRTLVEPEEPDLLAAASRASAALGLARTPRLRLSPVTPAPLVVGLWRPQIVLPGDLCQELNSEQLDAILLHETAHVAHHDQWARLMQRLAGAIFWPLPLVHMVNRRLSALREEICDNYVVRSCGTGRCLAEVLVVLAERVVGAVPRPVIVGLLEPVEGGLPGRIERLLQKERNTMTRMNFLTFSATALFGVAIGATALVMTVRAADEEKTRARKVEGPAVAKDENTLARLPCLGMGREAIQARCGKPANEVTLVSGIESLHFQMGDYRSIVEISPKTKKAIQVFYFKKTAFTKSEIKELLAQNAEGKTWKPKKGTGGDDRFWERSDGGSSRGGELAPETGKAGEFSFIVLSVAL